MIIKKRVLFLVRLPPPMHGAAKMNSLYLNSKILKNEFNIHHIKLNSYSSLVNNIFKYFLVLFGFFKVLLLLLFKLIFFKPKLVYFEIAPKGGAFYRDSIYLWICKLFFKKVVCQFHAKGVYSELSLKFKIKYYKSVFKNVKVILLSESLYSDVSLVIPKSNIFYLPNGIKDELTDIGFKKLCSIKKDSKILNLLYLSNMIETKGSLDVLKICDLLKNKGIKFKCNFVGNWDSDVFKEKWFLTLKKYNLTENCFYLGPKYGSEKNQLLSNVDYLVFPTKYPMECYPLVILEAFMFGVPVLSYNNGAIKDIINQNYLGFASLNNNYIDLYKYIINNKFTLSQKIKIRNIFIQNHLLIKYEITLKNIFLSVIK